MPKLIKILYIAILVGILSPIVSRAGTVDSLKEMLALSSPKESAYIYLQLSSLQDAAYISESFDYAEKALSIGERADDPQIIGRAYLSLAQLNQKVSRKALAIEYFEKSIPYLERASDSASMYTACSSLGQIYTNKSDYKNAYSYFNKAKDYVDTFADHSKLAELAKNFGNIYQSVGDYSKALESFEKSLSYAKESQDSTFMAYAIGSIGNVYAEWSLYNNAIDFFERALKLLDNTNNSRGKAIAYINMANALEKMGLYDSALVVAQKSADIFITYSMTEDIPDALVQIAQVHISRKDFADAAIMLQKALDIAKDVDIPAQMGAIYLTYGNLQKAKKDFEGAISFYKKSVGFFDQTDDKFDNKQVYELIAESLESAGKFEESLKYYKMFYRLSDSLYTESAQIAVYDMQSRYELESKNNQINTLNAEYSKNRAIIIITGFAAILLLIGGVIVYRQYISARRAKVQLEESNATKDKFFSIIAHDLRNPIGALLSASSMLRSEDYCSNVDDMKEYANDIHSSAVHISKLLEDLLTWARSQQGRIEYNPVDADISQIADNITAILGNHAHGKGIQIINSIQTELLAFCDINLTATILRNIVSNAVKFTPQGGSITISGRSDGETVFVSVADTGVGIPKDKLPSLFKVGATRSTTGTANETGTGLGLIICREFAERNGGSISAESEENVGTTFTFTMPAPKSYKNK